MFAKYWGFYVGVHSQFLAEGIYEWVQVAEISTWFGLIWGGVQGLIDEVGNGAVNASCGGLSKNGWHMLIHLSV